MNTLYRFLLSVSFVIFATSCEKFLDRDPLDQASENTFWNTEDDAIAGVNAVYTALPDARDFWRDCHSDNSVMTNAWGEGGMGYISMGSHTAADGYISEEWRYDLIRRALYALGQLSGMEIGDELRQRLISEVRFILAMRYFRMTQLFGDIPLIKEEPVALDEASLPRSSRSEVLAYAIDNANAAIEGLPVSYSGADAGRITKGAAYMLKANIYLYMASIKKFHENQHDAQLWGEAYQAAKQVTTLGYSLEEDYGLLFRSESNNVNNEVILARQYVKDMITHMTPVLASPAGTGITGSGWASFCPTRALVDSYLCTDGLTIQESSIYDVDNPWENRDERLKQTFMLPGVPVLRPSGEYTPYQPHPSYGMPERMNNEGGGLTGYMYLKFNEPTLTQPTESFTNWPIYRYAETFLLIAEALNEAEPGNAEIAEAINAVRQRAGVKPIGLAQLADQEAIREVIREERRHEFVAEHKRYFDILRWKMAESVLSEPAYGINSNVNDPIGDWAKPSFIAQQREFNAEKHYLWPIPQTAIDRNPNLRPQNPNW